MNAPSENPCRACDGRGWYAANGYTQCKICDGTGTIAPPPPAPSPGITLYIAGPMTGYPQLNYPAFHHAAKQLRDAGYTVLNPAEGGRPARNPTWEDWMRQAIGMLIQADHVATLDGWHESRGAVIEVNLASNLGMRRDSVDRHLEAATKMAGAA